MCMNLNLSVLTCEMENKHFNHYQMQLLLHLRNDLGHTGSQNSVQVNEHTGHVLRAKHGEGFHPRVIISLHRLARGPHSSVL